MHAKHLTPILNVSDIEQSFSWFERFGWSKCWDWKGDPAGPPTFGAVGSGECEIFLCLNGQGGRGLDEYDGRGVWMSIWVDNVDEVHAACVQQGLDIVKSPQDKPWGVREMHVRHPDGHMFRVGHSICE
jgi:catechol 2,3-dioxygenase-like lactoylglutathione lyase family enzyme